LLRLAEWFPAFGEHASVQFGVFVTRMDDDGAAWMDAHQHSRDLASIQTFGFITCGDDERHRAGSQDSCGR